jgi:hypothetical protein
MRVSVGQAALSTGVLALVLSSCQTAGFSRVFMAIDSLGQQPRKTFFTDSIQIVATGQYSAGRPDVTVDFRVRQLRSWNWDPPDGFATLPAHPLFAVGQATPGVQKESFATYVIPPEGIMINIQCYGTCVPNPPPGFNPCPPALVDQGADSCGPGATCCYDPFSTQPVTPDESSFPYPVGSYVTDFYIDGNLQGSSPFEIVFPDTPDPNIPLRDPSYGCPAVPPVAGVPCRLWVRQGTQCTGFEPTSDGKPSVCTCKTDLWECQ